MNNTKRKRRIEQTKPSLNQLKRMKRQGRQTITAEFKWFGEPHFSIYYGTTHYYSIDTLIKELSAIQEQKLLEDEIAVPVNNDNNKKAVRL